MDDSSTSSLTGDDLESIINRLDLPDGGFPSDAIEEARKRSQEITPLLIRLIKDATHDCRQGHLDDCYGHFIGVFLLAEFRAFEAWPAIRDAISLPDDKPDELFGDAITENFGCIIATLAGEGLDAINDLITDRSVDEYVRGAACEAVLYRVRDGLLTREDAIDCLASHLEKAIENQDEVAEGLVIRLEDLAAEHKLPLIERAFSAGLIDDDIYSLDDVKENIAEGTKVVHEKSSEVFGKVKEKTTDVYEAGTEAIENVTEKVHDFTERQKLQKELNSKKEQREEQVKQFGEAVLQEYLQKGSVLKRFLTTKKMSELVNKIKALDKSMEKITKQLS